MEKITQVSTNFNQKLLRFAVGTRMFQFNSA